MKEQERAANEEAEKRLKAALLTKREPGATASRLASPSVGASANPDGVPELNGKPSSDEQPSEDVSMEVEATSNATGSNSSEVSLGFSFDFGIQTCLLQSPWISELAALFDDIKKIAPGNAYDVIGYAILALPPTYS